MSAFDEMTIDDAAALANKLAPHLHPLAQQRAELVREQQALLDDTAAIELEIAGLLPDAQTATTKHEAAVAERRESERRELLAKAARERAWAPIKELRAQRHRNNARLQDIPLALAELDRRIAGGTTIRPRP